MAPIFVLRPGVHVHPVHPLPTLTVSCLHFLISTRQVFVATRPLNVGRHFSDRQCRQTMSAEKRTDSRQQPKVNNYRKIPLLHHENNVKTGSRQKPRDRPSPIRRGFSAVYATTPAPVTSPVEGKGCRENCGKTSSVEEGLSWGFCRVFVPGGGLLRTKENAWLVQSTNATVSLQSVRFKPF